MYWKIAIIMLAMATLACNSSKSGSAEQEVPNNPKEEPTDSLAPASPKEDNGNLPPYTPSHELGDENNEMDV